MSTPLPPSVEEAYRRKCIDLKKRMTEVEESNDNFRLRKIRLNRGIQKMRLERAYLLELLSKRMKKNGASMDGMPGVHDDDSEGSDEEPPTPQDRPFRSKRGHRRPGGSPPASIDQNAPITQSGYSYDQRPPNQHESPYGPTFSSNGPSSQPTSAQFVQSQSTNVPEAQTIKPKAPIPPSHNSMLTPIPAPEPFAMFFENNYLSQPHKHSGARTEGDLLALADKHWADPAFASQRQMYEAQADKQRARYESRLEMDRSARAQQEQQAQEVQGQTIRPTTETGEQTLPKIEPGTIADRQPDEEADIVAVDR